MQRLEFKNTTKKDVLHCYNFLLESSVSIIMFENNREYDDKIGAIIKRSYTVLGYS